MQPEPGAGAGAVADPGCSRRSPLALVPLKRICEIAQPPTQQQQQQELRQQLQLQPLFLFFFFRTV